MVGLDDALQAECNWPMFVPFCLPPLVEHEHVRLVVGDGDDDDDVDVVDDDDADVSVEDF